MVKCESCGAELPEGAKFCPSCGAAVGEVKREELKVSADNLVREVKELLHEGNITRIIVKDEKGKTLLEIPAWAGFVGAILAPWLAALGVIAALATDCTITVVRPE
jgi:CBS domain-containing protein